MEESSSYRAGLGLVNARLHSYAWIILLPAAAECTASVYYPSISLGGLDLQLAVLNVSGALLEGFFAAWESGAAVATGPLGDLFAFTADDVRGSFLSTYTSWAGMVGFAASLAQAIQRLMADVEAREAAPKTLSPARGYRLIAPSDATVSERTSLSPPMTAGAGGRGTSTARGSPLGYRSISSEDMPLPSKTLGRVYPSSLSAGILASRTLAKLDATGQFSASTGELPSNSTTERTSTAASTGRLSFVGRASLAERAPSLSPKPLSPLGAALRSGKS